MLVECPECGRQVSDRAQACPDCAFPVAEETAARAAAAAAEEERGTRVRTGETDCPQCEARGFETFGDEAEPATAPTSFAWCKMCEHTGRVHLVKSTRGFFAVSASALAAFLAGENPDEAQARFLGDTALPRRYPNNPNRFDA